MVDQLPRSSNRAELDARIPLRYEAETGRVLLLDQRKIPFTVEYFDASTLEAMVFAIKDMVVRGAPSIGVAAALGLAASARSIAANNELITDSNSGAEMGVFLEELRSAKELLQGSRPTAVNLRWATEEIFAAAASCNTPRQAADTATAASLAMIDEHVETNKAIGDFGAALVPDGAGVLTHCNAGALATCGWGTALGVVRSAKIAGKSFSAVYVDETRPRQQGARLTAWELIQDGLEPTLITDNMAGYVMSLGKVSLVIVGADRIATNGDVANKIGTYSLAVLAQAHGVPFYVAAPLSTFDPHIESGAQIPIEERSPEEVLRVGGEDIACEGTKVFNPSFDVTPARLVTAIITERGVLYPPYHESISAALGLI